VKRKDEEKSEPGEFVWGESFRTLPSLDVNCHHQAEKALAEEESEQKG